MTLELDAVEKTYAEFSLGPLDLTVDRGVLAVLGPSGSGKTTLLSLVAGITEPDAGSVRLAGRELVGRPLESRGVGVVFQEGALFPHMSARENVAYAASDDARIDELADLLELDGVLDRRPDALSGGERQRVALARTLAADPDALLLDEPLSSLDAPIRRRLREDLHDLFASLDIPVVYVTHDQRTATALGDRVALVRDGRIEQVDAPDALLARPASEFAARFTGTETLLDGRVTARLDDGVRVRVGPRALRSTRDVPPGTAVTVAVHPARIDLRAPDADAPNALDGTVSRWLHEADAYRVTVDIGETDVVAAVRPSTFDRLGVETGAHVRVSIPPDAVHLLPA